MTLNTKADYSDCMVRESSEVVPLRANEVRIYIHDRYYYITLPRETDMQDFRYWVRRKYTLPITKNGRMPIVIGHYPFYTLLP